MFSDLNFKLSQFIPQKLYWYIAGKIHPWAAVLEDAPDKESLYKRSDDVVKLLEKFKLVNKATRVLDIGCGVGRVEYKLAKVVKEVVGIDISPSMIKLAKENIKSKNAKFLVGNGKDLKGLGNSSFDLVISILVFQHMPRKIFENYIKESSRVLEKGGKIFFQISSYSKTRPEEPPVNHPWALRFYSQKDISTILNKSGFTKISFSNIDGGGINLSDDQMLVLATKS